MLTINLIRDNRAFVIERLRVKNFKADEIVEKFTVGSDRELDWRLAKYDIIGSMAHIKMLVKIGLLIKLTVV